MRCPCNERIYCCCQWQENLQRRVWRRSSVNRSQMQAVHPNLVQPDLLDAYRSRVGAQLLAALTRTTTPISNVIVKSLTRDLLSSIDSIYYLWWCHGMEEILTLFEGNPPVTGKSTGHKELVRFPSQSASNVEYWCIFDKLPNKPSSCWWFETPWRWYDVTLHVLRSSNELQWFCKIRGFLSMPYCNNTWLNKKSEKCFWWAPFQYPIQDVLS